MQTVLFKVKSGKYDRVLNVEFWPDYGIVFPDEITSNGNARMVANQVNHLVANYGCIIEPVSIDPGDCRDAEMLKATLIDAYLKLQRVINESLVARK
jgi:hypothetical protein